MIDLRLARVYFADMQYDKALSLVETPPKGYEWGYYMLQADIYAAQKENKKAQDAAQKAEQFVEKNPAVLALTQMKTNNLTR